MHNRTRRCAWSGLLQRHPWVTLVLCAWQSPPPPETATDRLGVTVTRAKLLWLCVCKCIDMVAADEIR